ncbi:MAG: PucC family protein [Anaerolineae bacterium]|nr:PucC family protein [Anaerolineae bacterium]
MNFEYVTGTFARGRPQVIQLGRAVLRVIRQDIVFALVFNIAMLIIASGGPLSRVGGTLNRVMIVELALPATLVGLLFVLPLLISPLRVWLGYRSDGYALGGLRREPYIVLGALLAGVSIIVATWLAVGGLSAWTVVAALLLTMATHHLGKNLATNTVRTRRVRERRLNELGVL